MRGGTGRTGEGNFSSACQVWMEARVGLGIAKPLLNGVKFLTKLKHVVF
jgi:hypothetical protein